MRLRPLHGSRSKTGHAADDDGDRIAACTRIAEAPEARLDRLNTAWMLEAGPPLAYAQMLNVMAAPFIWRNAIERASKLVLEERRQSPLGETIILRESIGTVLAVLTYNGPVSLMGMKVIPALLAGCPVI